jgi:inositol phosphorylceramide mannosyltransferase catalytic subunit
MPTIRQIWLGTKTPPLEWMQTWKEQNPDWSHITTHAVDAPLHNQRLFDHCCGEGMYDAAADVLRVELLYNYGGVYVDADTECLRPLDARMATYDFFAVEEPSVKGEYLVTNAFMGARPGSDFLRQYITALSRINPSDVRPGNCADMTGPGLLTRLLGWSKASVLVLPAYCFDRSMDGGPVFGANGFKPWLRHHYSSTHAKWIVGRPEKLATRGYPGQPEPRVVVKGRR